MIFNLLYYVVMSLSVSYMWSFSEIFRKPRNIISQIPYINKPFICPECCSFWIGLFVSFLYNPITLDVNIICISNVMCGLVTHLFASFIYKRVKKPDSIQFIN